MMVVLSCKTDKTNNTSIEVNEFVENLSSADTTAILDLSNGCMDLLTNGEIENALAMLYVYDDSTRQVSPLTEDLKNNYRNKFSRFPVREYTMSYFSFNNEGLNDVKYTVNFGNEIVGNLTTSYMFNPVKVDDQWYLTVKNSMQDVDSLLR